MIFGLSVVERATKLNATLVRQIIQAAQLELGQINPSAWRNPYFVGFFTTLIGLNSRLHFGDRASSATGGEILLRTWVHIDERQPAELSRMVNDLAMSKNADFAEGADNATRLFFTPMRRPDLDDPIVKSAFERGKQIPEIPELMMGGDVYTNASVVLMNELFIEPLRAYQD